jgi:pimeloyl-ACP methyl ester carboxylesterase
MRLDWQPLYPFESHFLDLGGLRYHYIDEGRGEPVVMVHGNPTWSFYYRNLVLFLRRRFRCIVPDHIGCGLSDKPDDRRYEYTLRRRVEDLGSLLSSLDLDRLNLVVHDWGGSGGSSSSTRQVSTFPLPRSCPGSSGWYGTRRWAPCW